MMAKVCWFSFRTETSLAFTVQLFEVLWLSWLVFYNRTLGYSKM